MGFPAPVSPPKKLSALIFDGTRLDSFFRTTAHSIVLARRIRLTPMRSSPSDSLGVRAIIRAMPDRWLPAEVELPEPTTIDFESRLESEALGHLFWRELDIRGAAGAKTFLEDLQAQRENAIDKVASIFREASRHNQGANEAAETIRTTLAVTKCAATIVVAGLSLPFVAAATGLAAGSALAGFAVGTGYSVGLKLVKSWDHADGADLVLVATKKAGGKTAQKGAKELAKHLGKAWESEAQDVAQAERKIEWLSKRIDETGRTRDVRRLAQAKDALQTAKNASRLSTAAKAVPYLFFVWSSYEAVRTLREDLH